MLGRVAGPVGIGDDADVVVCMGLRADEKVDLLVRSR